MKAAATPPMTTLPADHLALCVDTLRAHWRTPEQYVLDTFARRDVVLLDHLGTVRLLPNDAVIVRVGGEASGLADWFARPKLQAIRRRIAEMGASLTVADDAIELRLPALPAA